MKMGLREANQNFSKAIKAIKSGKAIVLTERGKPIATITPIVDEAKSDELQPLRDEGFLSTVGPNAGVSKSWLFQSRCI
jgi:prevent-host-death family protein